MRPNALGALLLVGLAASSQVGEAVAVDALVARRVAQTMPRRVVGLEDFIKLVVNKRITASRVDSFHYGAFSEIFLRDGRWLGFTEGSGAALTFLGRWQYRDHAVCVTTTRRAYPCRQLLQEVGTGDLYLQNPFILPNEISLFRVVVEKLNREF